ncbi:hypothetical protein [Methylocella sp.]|uniref:hypothetical protein n=1 Tax=Methylocella sp. TaxID=1978226 RepID=UPI00378336AC
MRQIAPGQCPAAAFLNDLRGSTAAPVRLEAPALGRAGETFSGVVKGAGAREAYVLLVGEDGVARLAAATHGGADEPASFSIRPPSDAAAGQRQLLVAIAAPKPLTSLRIGQNGAPAAKLFPQVLAEAGRAGFALGADMRSFSLEQ